MIKAHDKISKITFPAVAQRKHDGVRVEWTVDTEACTAVNVSRNGNPFTSVDWMVPHVVEFAKQVSPNRLVILDGELLCGDTFQETSGNIRRREPAPEAKMVVFNFSDGSELVYSSKSAILNRSNEGPIVGAVSHMVHDREELDALYQQWLDEGEEGAIVKNTDNDEWVRMKPTFTADVIIKGFTEGKGRLQDNLGALVIEFNGKDGKVASGLDDEGRSMIWLNQNDYLGRMVEVQYKSLTNGGAMRHPVFVGFRDDPENKGVKI